MRSRLCACAPFGALSFILAACSYSPLTLRPAGDSDAPPASAVVALPIYPEYGRNWLDYVGGDPNESIWLRTDEPCTHTYADVDGAPRYHACAHGGELRRIETQLTSCENAWAADNLAAFAWGCALEDGRAVFYSMGLHRHIGLAGLIDFTIPAWRPLSVQIQQHGVEVARTEPTVWWENPVVAAPIDPDHTIQLGMDRTIYVVAADAVSDGIHLASERMALVIAPGATLTYSGLGNDNCDAAGGYEPPLTSTCFIASRGQRFLWIEGRFDADLGPTAGRPLDVLALSGTHFTVLQRLELYGGDATGLWLDQSTNNMLSRIQVAGSATGSAGDAGIKLLASHANELEALMAHDSHGVGVLLVGSARNRLTRISAWRNGQDASGSNIRLENSHRNHLIELDVAASIAEGISLAEGSSGNSLVNVRAASNDDEGIWITQWSNNNSVAGVTCIGNRRGCVNVASGSSQNTISHVTAMNNGSEVPISASGVGVLRQFGERPVDNTVGQVLVVNGQGPGIYLDADGTRLFRLAVTECDTGIDIVGGAQEFLGPLLFGANGQDCAIDTMSDAGGLDSPITCSSATASAILTLNEMANALAGEVDTDSANPSTELDFDQVTNWLYFDSPFRGWGLAGSEFPNADNIGACLAGAICQLWDARLVAGDVTVRNTSGAGTSANAPFVPGQLCPSAVQGDVAIADLGASPQTFLVNAFESLFDEVGDDDGLCESHEVCVYSPNFGAYQGEGNQSAQACVFADGNPPTGVVDVLMLALPTNGVP